jgi:hypothetical protein
MKLFLGEMAFLISPLLMNFRIWTYPGNNPRTRSRAFTFILCLIVSFVAWLSIKLSKETTRVVPLEISINNIPDNLIFTHLSDSAFALSLQTTGIRLLSQQGIRGTNKLETDFSSLQKLRGDEENVYFYTAAQAESRYSLLNEISRSRLSAHPDTIYFAATRGFRKKVPVLAQLQIDYRPGFKLYNYPRISPDSVYVTGPERMKDSVNFIHTDVIKANLVDKSLTLDASLINPLYSQNIRLSETRVSVKIPVEEFTEATVELPLTINCPDLQTKFPESRILLFPESVDIHYLVAMKDIRTITVDMFKVMVHCPDTTGHGKARLPISVTEHPGLVNIIRTRPSDVEYVWIKN